MSVIAGILIGYVAAETVDYLLTRLSKRYRRWR